MTSTHSKIHDFFANLLPFAQLSKAELADLADRSEFTRYRMGQTVLMREQMPEEIIIVFSDRIRLLAHHPQHQTPTTLQLLEKGEILGWAGIVRNIITMPPIQGHIKIENLTFSFPGSSVNQLNRPVAK